MATPRFFDPTDPNWVDYEAPILEPAQRLIDEPTDDAGWLLGWRAKDVPDDELSDDDYAAQFTRHEVVPGSVSVDGPVRRTLTVTLDYPDAD